jgi:phosphoserine phosphatase RsbX
MIQTFTQVLALLEYGVASVTAPNHQESGDRHLVKTTSSGVLLAVIDGSGHGKDAAAAARLAAETVEAYPHEDVISLFQRCHDRLRTTRGASMSIATIDGTQNTLTWAGVGNTEGMILRFGSPPRGFPDRLLHRPGILGYRLPSLQAPTLPIRPGDVIILTTDGIKPGFEHQIPAHQHLRIVANTISTAFSNPFEDSLVLAARYLGDNQPFGDDSRRSSRIKQGVTL